MKQAVLTSALAVLALSGIGQARSQESTSPAGITALGHSEIKEKPDVARVTLSVTTNARHSADAVQQNAEQTTAIMTALQGVGIAAKDVQTQSYTVQPTFDYSESPPKRKGYAVK